MATTVSSITFRNYRSYGDTGATLPMSKDFVAIVGVNNTGKSTLLRSFWELREIYRLIGLSGPGQYLIQQMLTIGYQILPLVLEGERVYPTFDEVSEPRIRLNMSTDEPLKPSSVIFAEIIIGRDGLTRLELGLANGQRIARAHHISGLVQEAGLLTGFELSLGEAGSPTVSVDWVPAQNAIATLADSFYVAAFRNALNSGDAPLYDLRVGRGFLEAYFQYRHGPDPQQNEAAIKMENELREIFGFSEFQVNVSTGRDYFICNVNGKSYRQQELGAGIMQFVIVAVSVLINRPTILLIDEPELNLHASLQARFLSLLASYSSGPVFFSTHSLGLARSTADEILVSVRNESNRSVLSAYSSQSNLSFTLGALGYGGLQDSAYRAVLLVEGVTEVRAMQRLLIKYGAKNTVVIVPLGGGDMATGGRDVELAELGRLSEKVFAIVDSERSSAGGDAIPERVDFQRDCSRLGIKCLVLERRSLENYLDQDVARGIFRRASAVEFGHYEKYDDSWSWDKGKNWRIVDEMEVRDFDSTDLGTFISGMMLEISST